jgi:Leucine-rich repeat (LRR) protein
MIRMMINRYIIRKFAAILALTVSAAFMLVACAKEPKEPAVVTMTTKASEVAFYVSGTGDISIDWGDGKVSNMKDGIFYAEMDWFLFNHDYSGETAHNIVITGNVTLLYCQDNGLTALDMSLNTTLKYLKCNRNQLTALDVSKNIALISLECNYNQITKLDVSKNRVLNILSIVGNQFTAAALNDLFGTLPDYSKTDISGSAIFISNRSGSGNPGNLDCDRSIAEKRGWHFRSIK